MDKEDGDEPSAAFLEGIAPFKMRRDQARQQEVGMKLMEIFTSLDLGEEPNRDTVKELKDLLAKMPGEVPDELKFLFALLDNPTNPRAALDVVE
jgi:adenylylsulfate kinase-like enzyme